MKIKASRLFAVLMATTLMAGPMMLVASPAAAETQQDEGFKRRFVLANQLIESVGTKAAVSSMMNELSDLMSKAIKSDPDFAKLPQADQDKLIELLLEELQVAVSTDLIDVVATEYANAFTEDELNQIVTIYKSPLMQKVVSVGTTIQNLMPTKGRAIGEQAAQRAIVRWLEWKQKQGK